MNNLKKILENRIIFLLAFGMFIVSGCAHSLNLKLVRDNFYNYNDLSKEVNSLSAEFRNTISIEEIGKTYEGRSIFVIKITGNSSSHKSKPALMAIFAEHAGEHDVASLAMGVVKYLTENYGNYKKITKLLDEKEVYIIPMMNPDGVEYDLSGEVKPFTWRKNRRPVGENVYGVDLNRNWGYKWDAVPEELVEQYSNPKDDYYHGENPFSENETQSVRDFVLSHKNIKMSFGVEIMRNGDFFDKLPDNKNRLIENQIRGFLFLLETLSENPFDGNGT